MDSNFLLLNASKTNILKKNEFGGRLIEWYNHHKRDLPWRKTNDPYRIWLSEIILQQTRVAQGLPYYNKFVKNYPTIKDLAEADQDRVLKDWEGLGYYSRARNMQSAAQYVQGELSGEFPVTYDSIIKLKGVGDYTASAISSFAFGEAKAVLDGNVFRVLSRVFDIDTPINSTKGKKDFGELANDFLFLEDPATYNQAIMEFGALQCVPKSPKCGDCILQDKCGALAANRVSELPKKDKKSYKRDRFFNYLLVTHNKETLVKQRLDKDIWLKLFDFPLIESSSLMGQEQIIEGGSFDWLTQVDLSIKNVHDLKPHLLSHQRIFVRIIEVDIEAKPEAMDKNFQWHNEKNLQKLAFPKPLRSFLDRKQLTLPFA